VDSHISVGTNGSFTNSGDVKVNGNIHVNGGSINNTGLISMVDFDGHALALMNNGLLTNSGVVAISYSKASAIGGMHISNGCSLVNTGNIAVSTKDTSLLNQGNIDNSGHIRLLKTNIFSQDWTPLVPSKDSRLIYVSASLGNDATAEHYKMMSPEIRGSVFSPLSSIKPYATIAAAKAQLRVGFPDYLILKTDDVWSGQTFGSVAWSGRSADEPMVIAAYGEGARPLINTAHQTGISLNASFISHLSINDIALTPQPLQAGVDPSAIHCLSQFRNIHFENCSFTAFPGHMTFHSNNPNPIGEVRKLLTVRRCIMADASALNNAGGQNFFINDVDSILMEECVLDHNGWNLSIGSMPTAFRHNSYFQVKNSNVIFRKNIVTRAAATGIGMRCGGIVENNLVVENVNNLQFGTSETTINYPTEFVTGSITNNVIINARQESFDAGRGIFIAKAKNIVVKNNIVKSYTPMQLGTQGMIVTDGFENITIDSNIVYNWCQNIPFGPATFFSNNAGLRFIGPSTGTSLIRHNHFQQSNPGGGCITASHLSNLSFLQNKYYSATQNNSFQEGSINYPSWVANSGETGSTFANISYPDPNRDITTYMTSIGQSGGLPELIDMLKIQTKENWSQSLSACEINDYIREGFQLTSSLKEDNNDGQEIKVYPNPSDGQLKVKVGQTSYQGKFKLLDSMGTEVIYGECVDGYIDVKNIKSGVFVLQIQGQKPKLVYIQN
jgi:hypothetical protein